MRGHNELSLWRMKTEPALMNRPSVNHNRRAGSLMSAPQRGGWMAGR